MRLHVNKFGGMRPQSGTDLLLPGEAASAINVRLSAGELRPLNDLSATVLSLTSGSAVKSIYRFGQDSSSQTQYWFQSTGDVDYAKGPIDNDTVERTYFTDGSFPKKTDSTLATSSPPYPSASYAMGIPAPATAPTVAVSGSPTNASDPAETVIFVLTYVSAWGEEGPPSAASNSVSWQPGQTLNLTTLATAPGSGAHGENYNITGKRLYRSATGSQATQLQLVNTSSDIPIANTTYSTTTLTANLGDVLVTLGWIEPPYNMTGLRAGPNGLMSGFVANTICLCEPNIPYAWPVKYQQTVDATIVAAEWFDQTLWIGTSKGQYLLTGADPANMTLTKLASTQSCASKRGVVAMSGGVMFPSPDGLYFIDANGLKPMTAGLMERADWQFYLPASFTSGESDGRYIAFYDTGSIQGTMVFDFANPPSFSVATTYATAVYRDKKYNELFVVDTSKNIKKFDAGSALSLDWTSGVFHLPADQNFGAASVDASAYPVTFKLYADGALKHTQTVNDRFAFRMPSGFRSKRYYFEVTGTATIRDVEIASTMQELTQQ